MASAIRIDNPASPKFTLHNTTDRQVLNYASLGENSNKYYIIELQEGSGDYGYRIYTEYGRMGKTPAREGRYFTSRWDASNEFDSIIRSKEAKGYRKVDVDDGFSIGTATVRVASKTAQNDLSKINDKVLKLIGKLYSSATNYIVKSITTPLGKLSAYQVAEGLKILGEIESLLDAGTTGYQVERLTNEFYSVIPVTFGSKADYNRLIINTYNKLNERKDLLGVMNSVVKAQNELEKSLEDKYKSLNIKLKALSSRTKEYKRISELVQSTKGHNHHFGLDIKEIYEVQDMLGYKDFNPYKVSVMELFHGSRNENILSIMQNGLKIKPKSAVHSGSMFGAGIYFADQSTKSANYCSGFGSASNNGLDTNFLFLCDVATGKMKEYEDAQPQLSSAPRGYNSVKGKKGRSLIHNEFIVYHENQAKIRYIIEYKRK